MSVHIPSFGYDNTTELWIENTCMTYIIHVLGKPRQTAYCLKNYAWPGFFFDRLY